METFINDFEDFMANLLGISSSDISVTDVREGSIIVEFLLSAAAVDSGAVETLIDLVQDANSALFASGGFVSLNGGDYDTLNAGSVDSGQSFSLFDVATTNADTTLADTTAAAVTTEAATTAADTTAADTTVVATTAVADTTVADTTTDA